MKQFPQLVEADFEALRRLLEEFLDKTGASLALLVERAGYLILGAGDAKKVDTTQLATLAANAFAACQFIAEQLGNTAFNSMFQQGDPLDALWRQVDETCLLVTVFPTEAGVGFVRYHAETTARLMAERLSIAREHTAGPGLDLSDLNPRDVAELFKKKDQ